MKLSILKKHGDSPLAGHLGQEKTLKLVKWDFQWSGMTQFIKDYVLSCQQCSRNKNIHHKKFELLKPLTITNVKTSTIPNQNQEPPPPIIIEDKEEREVSQIMDSKTKRGNLWYLVEWKGFSKDPERSTWEPTKNLKNCPEPIKDFHSLYPDKPGTNPSRA
ncbi:hypothetical protein O181_106961 [Austropuccinia psidii MF-1]|uniref:Chromo domain-containing protein n=1 Tax=Austropuccinia psidii MF-1 TaxID=1389203 RepID=A0A9Q3PNP8_9BASI|nr:hypothetical protein [Austropuccinia psidii MF-1]